MDRPWWEPTLRDIGMGTVFTVTALAGMTLGLRKLLREHHQRTLDVITDVLDREARTETLLVKLDQHLDLTSGQLNALVQAVRRYAQTRSEEALQAMLARAGDIDAPMV